MNPKEVSTVLVPQYLLTSEQKSVIQSKIDEAMTKLHIERDDAASLIYSHVIDDFFGKEVIVARLTVYENENELGDELSEQSYEKDYGKKPRRLKSSSSKAAKKMTEALDEDIAAMKPKDRKLSKTYNSKPEDYLLLKFDSEAELMGALKMWDLAGFEQYKVISIVVNGKKKEFNTKTSGAGDKSYKLDVAFGEEMEGREAGEEMCCEASE